MWTHKRNRRTGHVFEGRFKAIVMEEEGYLRSVSAYVHLNPVRVRGWNGRPVAERLDRLTKYPWSSYPELANCGASRPRRFTAGDGRMRGGMWSSTCAGKRAGKT